MSGVPSTRRRCLGPAVAALTVAFIAAGRSAPAVGQQATFKTSVEAVRVDVLVTEDGQPVHGLLAGDFEVRDNGVPQRVNLVSFEQIPLAIVLAFDASQSVAGQRLADLRAAAHSLLGRLRPDDEVGLVTFCAAVTRVCEMTRDHERVAEALDAIQIGRGTALVDACEAGMMAGADPAGRSLMIVFSDGLDVSSWLAPTSVVETAKRADVVAYAVIANGRMLPWSAERDAYEAATRRTLDSRRFLKDLAAATGGDVVDLDSTRQLEPALIRILDEFRHRYLISYVPEKAARDGWHKLEVKVKGRRGATVKARPGYQGR